ncbi:exodeoxyribonuclease VII large subunit [Aestuariibius insulae]|uniref:exodeoxyribonuclease VII large subunit n=1 Tax=Aestuariibius insulae TaxID=2058287 RepID=UPI00345E6D90
MDLIDDGQAGNAPEFTVSELSGAVKRVVEGEFSFVRVRGEVGRVSRPRSGHLYLDLKDDRSVIAGVIWKGRAQALATQPEEGMEVVATGRLTTFPGQSKYQIVIEEIAPAGVGALMAMLEKRKAMLAAEGLFEQSRKRPLPYLPEVIGVVTSPSGAVIRDILHRLRDRFPRKVLVWPVAVQGQACAPDVTRAIHGFNALSEGGALPRPDLLIVARGGGSLEDLWGFNEESVVRAAAESDIPLISAVGHETDTTLIDFVSDRRAPTPTAAAELAVPVRLELLTWIGEQETRLSRAVTAAITQRRQRLRDLTRALPRSDALTQSARQRLDLWETRLPDALRRTAQVRRIRLGEVAGSLRPGLLRRGIESDRQRLIDRDRRLTPALSRRIAMDRERLARRSDGLKVHEILKDLNRLQMKLLELERRLSEGSARVIADRSARLEALVRLHETLGYRATLERGYAVVRDGDAVLTRKAQAETAQHLEIEFADGRLPLNGKPKKASRKPPPPEQGTLL